MSFPAARAAARSGSFGWVKREKRPSPTGLPGMADGGLVARKSEEDGVEVLILRNPPVNALSTALLAALDHHLAAIESDPQVRAVILTAEGPYFSAGADLKEMASLDLTQAPDLVRRGHALFARIATLRVPVVAAINGL